MKNVLLLSLLSFGVTFAQSPTDYSEVLGSNNEFTQPLGQIQATITRTDTNRLPIIDTYVSMTDFDAAVLEICIDTSLLAEDFTNGPTAITPCGASVSSAGDGCFAAGELEEGFVVTVSNDGDVINIPPGSIGNTDSLVGASSFSEFTIVTFDPPVFAVAMDIWENNEPLTLIRLFGDGGALIASFDVTTPINSQTFLGLITDEPISVIELEGPNESGELFGNFFYGADDCTVLSVNDNLQELISVSPNPTSDVLFIQTPASITVDSVIVYDALGKAINVRLTNNQINIGSLTTGVYFLQMNTNQGRLTKKIVKK